MLSDVLARERYKSISGVEMKVKRFFQNMISLKGEKQIEHTFSTCLL